jgi:hypothetical protein
MRPYRISSARNCYQRAGLAAQWGETVRQVRTAHHRKTGFVSEFESVAAGARRAEKPSFLERAKARWGERHGGGKS